VEARNANLKVRKENLVHYFHSNWLVLKYFAEDLSFIYLFNWDIKNGFMNYIEITLSLFDLTPSIQKISDVARLGSPGSSER